MTTAIIGGVETEVRELASREDLLRQAFDAMAAYDRAVRGLVAYDLTDLGPGLREDRDKKKALLQAAEDVLTEAGQPVPPLRTEIAECDEKVAALKAGEGGDLAARVEARKWITEYEAERAELVKKLDFAEGRAAEKRAERDRVQTACDMSERALGALLWATTGDQYGPAGQRTGSYYLWRFKAGRLVPLLWNREQDHHEYPMALDLLRELCLRTGYRTDGLPSNAEQAARAMTAAMADASDAPPPPAPSAAELKMIDEIGYENTRLQQIRTPVEDRRGAQPTPAPPGRSYMDVPRLRDFGQVG